jgi:hypothetical protein
MDRIPVLLSGLIGVGGLVCITSVLVWLRKRRLNSEKTEEHHSNIQHSHGDASPVIPAKHGSTVYVSIGSPAGVAPQESAPRPKVTAVRYGKIPSEDVKLSGLREALYFHNEGTEAYEVRSEDLRVGGWIVQCEYSIPLLKDDSRLSVTSIHKTISPNQGVTTLSLQIMRGMMLYWLEK